MPYITSNVWLCLRALNQPGEFLSQAPPWFVFFFLYPCLQLWSEKHVITMAVMWSWPRHVIVVDVMWSWPINNKWRMKFFCSARTLHKQLILFRPFTVYLWARPSRLINKYKLVEKDDSSEIDLNDLRWQRTVGHWRLAHEVFSYEVPKVHK
jgi:hypothetical protein